jgi:ABC-type transport system involved in multi-copper enzyme maturation permease subunit
MSAETVTPYRSRVQSGGDGFAQLLRAEWTKFHTVRGWVIGMLVAVLVTAGLGLIGPLGYESRCIAPPGQVCHRFTPPVGPGGEWVDDQFYFVHQSLTGDGGITIRVTSLTGVHPDLQSDTGAQNAAVGLVSGTDGWAKAGIIIKNGTGQGSAYAAMMVTGSHGVRMQDDFVHDTAGLPGSVSSASPRWLRLVRSGDTITGYDSADGTSWSEVGTATLAGLPSTVQAGMFAATPNYTLSSSSFGGTSSASTAAEATGAFDSVGLQGGWRGNAWSGTPVGQQGNGDPGLPPVGYQQVAGGYTVSGSGDIAPGEAGPGSGGKGVGDALVGAFAGLIAVIVVAAMFITAEYRRGLIRLTLAASPRRGRVLAAKAVVIGAVTFAVGLIAVGLAVPLVQWLEVHKGMDLRPTPIGTEVRVIVGTAALLAVAAVLALGVGAMIRRSAGAVAAVIVLIVLPYLLGVASVLPTGAADWVLRTTPAAAFAIQQTEIPYPQVDATYTPGTGYFPLAPWAGFAVLCAYAAVALGFAFLLLQRRDA